MDQRGTLWRSIEEDSSEKPRDGEATDFVAPFQPDRRQFLQVMAASLALGGLGACDFQPPEDAVPLVSGPEALQTRRYHYATSVPFAGYAMPVVASCSAGRPLRVDGNARHPMGTGTALDVFAQSEVLRLYDPDRSRGLRGYGQPADKGSFAAVFVDLRTALDGNRGRGFRILTGATTSPTEARLMAAPRARWPEMRWHAFEPLESVPALQAMTALLGKPMEPRLDLGQADAVVAFEADPLGPGPHQILHSAQWSARRRANGPMPRLFVAESSPTLTGAAAGSGRLPAEAGRMATLVVALAQRLDRAGGEHGGDLSVRETAWVNAAAAALRQAGPRGLIIAGPWLPADVQAFAFSLNTLPGGIGTALRFAPPAAVHPRDAESGLEALVTAMRAGSVSQLVVIDCNPAFHAPLPLDFQQAMARVALRIHAGTWADETAALCQWHLPLAHPLESWGDGRAPDGTVTLRQPTVAPLFGGWTVPELLTALRDGPSGREGGGPAALSSVRETWAERFGGPDGDRVWRKSLQDGFLDGTAPPPADVRSGDVPPPRPASRGEAIEIAFRPDPSLWDGRYANCAWLQELPKPLTKVTWDTVALASPAAARQWGAATGEIVRLTIGGHTLEAPLWAMPGQAERTVTLAIAGGRTAAGRLGTGVGYAVAAVWPGPSSWQAEGTVSRTGRTYDIATTQAHGQMGEAHAVRTVARESDRVEPEGSQPSLYPEWPQGDRAWGMVIDLDVCTGCNACVIACQAENNVTVVGKREVAMGRNMHWLRVDRYYQGEAADPAIHFQPVPCMHCEKAPCELGCPVNATVHDAEGINQMVYNRCIGTRTCANYCPYKVRRFNYFDYAGRPAEQAAEAQRNPNVTVRSRGVMEKCTYCIQRVAEARIVADKENRPIRDGEVRTACQDACPTNAIVFGDLKDVDSKVRALRDKPRNYALLRELNTRPRTTYLAKIEEGKE